MMILVLMKIVGMKTEFTFENVPVSKLEMNKGQLQGLPKNPRFFRDNRYEAMKKSISDSPEMLQLRELIVYPYNDKYIVVCGNLRLRACKELGYTELPCTDNQVKGVCHKRQCFFWRERHGRDDERMG